MIARTDVMPLLLEAVPSFGPVWDEDDAVHDGERLLYLDAASFIRHLVARYRAGDSSEFGAAFAVIERFVVEGDDDVRDLGVTGFLEGLQNQAVTDGLDPEMVFRPFVGPVSGRWWERLNRFWSGEVDALRVEEP